MILKLEGTDREIITLFEGLMELSLMDEHRTPNIEHLTSNGAKPAAAGIDLAYQEAGAKGPSGHADDPGTDARPGDYTFWRLFYALYLHPNRLSVNEAYRLASGKAMEQPVVSISIPGLDQVRYQLKKLDRDLLDAARTVTSDPEKIDDIFPELQKKDAGQKTSAPGSKPKTAKRKPGKAKLHLSYKAPRKTPKPPKHMPAGAGSKVSIEKLLKVGLNGCADIPAVINKLQLETNITGTHLAELFGIHASDISRARKGVIPPFVERAFKQHLQFPKVEEQE